MLSSFWSVAASMLNAFLGLATLVLLLRSKSVRAYWPLLPIALWDLPPYLLLLWLRKYRVLIPRLAYASYFYTYWIAFAIAAVAAVILTYTIFSDSLRPLKGLHRLGIIIYRWVLTITTGVVFSVALIPTTSDVPHIRLIVIEMQRVGGIMVLSLLLFVVFTIRPLRLSPRSRIFGVSLGLGVATLANVLLTAYFVANTDLYGRVTLLTTFAECIAQIIWIWYFSHPEPARDLPMLPTTSPFHGWNAAAAAMGEKPGFVAIAGIPPERFSPAELTLFERMAKQDLANAPQPPSRAESDQQVADLLTGSAPETIAATQRFTHVWNGGTTDAGIPAQTVPATVGTDTKP